MNGFERAVQRRYGAIVCAVSLGVIWIFAVRSGQDANWDQLNYHLAVPFLLLHGGFWDSVAPAGIQSYLNPTILIPQFLAITHLPPIAATLAIAIPQAAVFALAGLICRDIARAGTADWARPALAGFALCLMSPIALSEAGTTYVDLVTALPVLAALLLLGRATWRHAAAAGAMLGIAAGLKLTNAMYVFAVPWLVLVWPASRVARLSALALAGIAAIAGFAASAGWWHIEVWHHFVNPVFPFANAIFRSPDFPPVSMNDDRFLPNSAWAVIRWPWRWIVGGGGKTGLLSPGAEVDPKDLRFLPTVVGIAALALASAFSRNLRVRLKPGLIAAWLCVFLIWLAGFGIHRYMVGLEILTGAALLTLCLHLPQRLATPALVTLVAAAFIVLHVPRWTRVPFEAHWQAIEPTPIALDRPALVFLADAPTSYVVASMPDDTRIAVLSSDFDLRATQPTSLVRQVRTILAQGRTPYLLFQHNDADALLAGYALHRAECRPQRIGGQDFTLCRLQETP